MNASSDPATTEHDEIVGGPAEELPPLPEDVEAASKAAGREFPCSQCGASLAFAPGAQKLECPYCRHVQEVALGPDAKVAEQDLEAMLARLAARRGEEGGLASGLYEVR